jgi:hypothetical protein
MGLLFFKTRSRNPVVREPMIGRCSECKFEAPVEDFDTEQEGDWEYGYYDIHICPKCEDGGCVDDYRPVDGEEL